MVLFCTFWPVIKKILLITLASNSIINVQSSALEEGRWKGGGGSWGGGGAEHPFYFRKSILLREVLNKYLT
jgi:uncharacterized membrane protein YgcG